MPARIDPFVDVLLRERGDQLYLLPDEPVTMVKDGKPRKVSRQPLTDQHIYALLVEVAPSESADRIDQMAETEFEYVADRGLVRVRIVPEGGRLTAMVAPLEQGTLEETVVPAAAAREASPRGTPRPTPSPRAVPPAPPPPTPPGGPPPRPRGRGPAGGAAGPRYCAGAAGRGPGPPIPGGREDVGGAVASAGPHQVVRPAPPRG